MDRLDGVEPFGYARSTALPMRGLSTSSLLPYWERTGETAPQLSLFCYASAGVIRYLPDEV